MIMTFRNQEDLENFLSDKKYYAGKNNYCLGETLEEAGEIFRKIVEDKADVGMDTSRAE